MPDLPRKTNEQIKCLREFLNVASLSVFTKQNMAVSFRSASEDMKEANIARANAMVQIAINQALKIEGKCKIIRRIVLPQKISHNNQ